MYHVAIHTITCVAVACGNPNQSSVVLGTERMGSSSRVYKLRYHQVKELGCSQTLQHVNSPTEVTRVKLCKIRPIPCDSCTANYYITLLGENCCIVGWLLFCAVMVDTLEVQWDALGDKDRYTLPMHRAFSTSGTAMFFGRNSYMISTKVSSKLLW